MHDLSWVRKQGEIIEEQKRRIRRENCLPIKEKLDAFAELYETFENKLNNTKALFYENRRLARIELQNRIKRLNSINNSTGK